MPGTAASLLLLAAMASGSDSHSDSERAHVAAGRAALPQLAPHVRDMSGGVATSALHDQPPPRHPGPNRLGAAVRPSGRGQPPRANADLPRRR